MNWLVDKFSHFGDKDCLVIENKNCSYNSLVNEISLWTEIITLSEILPGTVVSIEGGNSLSLISLFFALYLNQNIIVPINVDSKDKIKEYQEIAGVQYSINVKNDKGFISLNLKKEKNKLYKSLNETSNSGLVLFSSGTTGKPKAIVLNLSKLLIKSATLNKPNIILSFLAYDHIGGINTIIHTLSSGGCIVFPENRKVDTILKCIEKWKVEILPTTPTFINMLLLADAFKSFDLTSLKLVTYGTEAMPSLVLKRVTDKLPSVKFKQTYGLSEVGILPTKSKDNNELWIKIGENGFKHKIVDDILWIKSDYAMLGYLNAEAPFDEQGYFNTQDVVEVNGDYIRILGRKTDIINVGGEKVYPSEIEGAICQVPGVLDATVWGVKNPIMGMGIKAIIKYSPELIESSIKSQVINHVKESLEEFKHPLSYTFTIDDLHSSRFKKIRTFQ